MIVKTENLSREFVRGKSVRQQPEGSEQFL